MRTGLFFSVKKFEIGMKFSTAFSTAFDGKKRFLKVLKGA